ncbi:Peptidase M1, membrane alanine aminopeptidase, N-terminal domain-containing protein [Strongyloides ratti]|uniref:Peptidase M1, membrane alanine aminopeptidase, N-terminal domain-containing protein n=1 Tax=Strongyloides ratti TaxID=34506 RepID=A0A090LF30_STRRB|nr:Peptidase M1, membrane alanine aminopeptidase, N-terminal domain-containing protein [Strongyloides ratti]CEF68401.1 Peptidase M1, membrane alanine aminopeptidase, N-terminal domain-containing protein [Strongyloides ratti]
MISERKEQKRSRNSVIFAATVVGIFVLLSLIILRFALQHHEENELAQQNSVIFDNAPTTQVLIPNINDIINKLEENEEELVNEIAATVKTKSSTVPTTIASNIDTEILNITTSSLPTTTTTTTTTKIPLTSEPITPSPKTTETPTTTDQPIVTTTELVTTTEPTTTTSSTTTTTTSTTTTTTTTTTTIEVPTTTNVPITTPASTVTIPTEGQTTLKPEIINDQCEMPFESSQCPDTSSQSKKEYPSVSEISSTFIPNEFNLELTIKSLTFPLKVTGSMTSQIKILNTTNTLFINIGSTINYIYPSDIEIYDCKNKQFICLHSITRLMTNDMLILHLSSQLSAERSVFIRITKFTSYIEQRSNVVNIQSPRRWQKGTSSLILSSNFGVKNARMMFPSYDRLQIKIPTTLTITTSAEYDVRSNFPLNSVSTIDEDDGQYKKYTFQTIGSISANQIAFSIFKDTQNLFDKTSNPEIELITAQHIKKKDFNWLFQEVRTVIDEMESLTNSKYPLSKLTILATSINYDVLSSPGFIIVKEASLEYSKYYQTHTFLIKAIIQQWIGNFISSEKSNELCIQDGLLNYLEWTISSKLPTVNMKIIDRYLEAKTRSMRNEDSGFDNELLLRDIKDISDISVKCSNKAPLVFHMLSKTFGGKHFLGKLLTSLTYKHLWKTINLEEMSEEILEVTQSKQAQNLINQFFQKSGYSTLMISTNNNAITIKPITNNNWTNFDLPIQFIAEKNKKYTAKSTIDSIVNIDDNVSYIFGDPTNALYARILYNAPIYKSIASCTPDCDGVGKETIERTFNDFCWGLLNNKLVFNSNSEKNIEKETWKQFFKIISKKNREGTFSTRDYRDEVISQECNCCLHKTSSSSSACKLIWKNKCEKIDVVRMTFSK